MSYGALTGVGMSKAISCGNSAMLELADYLEYFGEDPETAVSLAYLEGVGNGRRFTDVARAHTARKPLVVVRGGVTERRQARREQSHRRARLRRPHLLRHLPAGRRHAHRDGRGGLRGRGGVRDPAAAARPAHPDLHGGRRLGRADLRRLRERRARADPPARRPAHGDRRHGPRALEPQQPDRPRRRRDARHDPRGARAHGRAPRRRRDRLPRDRDPGLAGADVPQRPVLARLRPRADRQRSTRARTAATRWPPPRRAASTRSRS